MDRVRVVGNDDIESRTAISPREAVAVVEQAFRELGEGSAISHPRQRLQTKDGGPVDEADTWYMFNCHMGIVPGLDSMAIRLNSRQRRIVDEGGTERMTYPRDVDFVVVFDIRDCNPKAVMPNNSLSMLRVAATTAIGTDRLAREDATRVGMFGAGNQARAHLETLDVVRDVERCRVYSPTPESRESYAEEMTARTGIDVSAVEEPEAAVRGADIVTLATNATEPVIDGAWLEPGMHVSSIVGGDAFYPRQEFDDETCRRADRFVTTDLEKAIEDRQAGIYPRIESGLLDPEAIDDLHELVVGAVPGRRGRDEITVFKNNTGMGIQFAATGAKIYENAEDKELGTTIPLDVFAVPYSRG